MYKYRCVRVFLLVWFHFVGLNLDVREIGRTACVIIIIIIIIIVIRMSYVSSGGVCGL